MIRSKLNLRRLPDGRYEVYWNERVGSKWRQRTRRLKTHDTREAEEAMYRLTLELDQPAATPKTMTVAEAVEAYRDGHLAPRGQVQNTRYSLVAPLALLGHMDATALSRGIIADYTADRLSGASRAAVGASTVRKELTVLQAALNWTMKHVLQTGQVYAFQKPADGARRDQWIDEGQEAEIRAALPRARLDVQIFIVLGLTYAVRRGAMLGLRFGPQVDFKAGVIDFREPGAAETRKRRATVPMTDEVRTLLLRRREEVEVGKVLRGYATLNAYRDFMEGIGYGWVTPHVLKHSAITLMVRGGAELDVVARLTNTSMETLLAHYRHHSNDELLAAATTRRAAPKPNLKVIR